MNDWVQFGTSQFKFITDQKTFEEAAEICKSQNSYLVEIQFENEQKFVREKLSYMITKSQIAGGSKVWIGLNDDYSKWSVSGDNLIHQDWCPPSNAAPATNGQRTTLDTSQNGCWNAVSPSETHPFICESKYK